jgi:adenylate cyclase
MTSRASLPLLELPEELAQCGGWSGKVYEDLLALEAGRMTRREFDARYLHRKAILTADITGFTATCHHGGELEAFLRILNVRKTCIPALREHGAELIRFFADDLVALFDDVGRALDASFEMHRRIAQLSASNSSWSAPLQCCIGLGWGDVYAIGPNLAMGAEMNRASKLGEDIACGDETLVTEGAFEALVRRDDVLFENLTRDDMLFSYFRVRQVTTVE